jgi:REP element-mobilizing transposase RayT
MARKPRLHFPGALYHVILRGNAQQSVFFEDRDRYRFYLLLQEGVATFGYRIHAFCLMTNHVHLAIEVGEIPLSRIMQNLSFRYTSFINRQLKRSGHLFQGRYKAVLVDADAYLLELVAYIHLNPVRAGMVTTPADYPWSSHRAYLGQEVLPWLAADKVLSLFDQNCDKATGMYLNFMGERITEGRNDQFHTGGSDSRLLGEGCFLEEAMTKAQIVLEIKPTINEIVAAVKMEYDIDDEILCSRQRSRIGTEARTLVAWAVAEFSDGTISEVGRLFNRDVTTLSACIKRMKDKSRNDPKVAAKMNSVKVAISQMR